ncbi:MAG TPA: hypothetical protein VFR94_14110 [Nitrososphaeraceae archaeon]|nr:hypothetical protein [Nitrososphaeraceae archaeon]
MRTRYQEEHAMLGTSGQHLVSQITPTLYRKQKVIEISIEQEADANISNETELSYK